jgi:hypothetical protein
MALKAIVTEFDFEGSLTEVAWMITGTSLAGVAAGAVYVTVVLLGLLRVPTAGVGEVIFQVVGSTPLFAGSKLTVAVIVEVPAGQGRDGQACTKVGFAERETAMAAKVNPTDPDFVGSLTDLAWITTCTSAGGVAAGAVYVTEVLVRLLRVPTAGVGEVIIQDAGSTPAFAGSLLTMAVICDVPAGQGRDGQACTGLTDAVTLTKIAGTSRLTLLDCVGSAMEVAVIVTRTSLRGGVAGAL